MEMGPSFCAGNQAYFNQNNLIVNLDPETQLNAEVVLLDVSGRELLRSTLSQSNSVLDCTTLNGGIYQLQIIGKSNNQTLKLVKPF
jgi:hypothetical protein